MKVLFICHGNVQRSQMAQGYYNYFIKKNEATSAGVDPLTPQQWSAPHPETIELMAEEGIDVTQQPVRLVTPQMVEEADKIFLITDVDVPDFVLNSPKVVQWDIKDPYGQPLDVVRKIKGQVKDQVLQLFVPQVINLPY